MSRIVQSADVDYSKLLQPVTRGGTAALTGPQSAINLGLLTNVSKGQALGAVGLDANGKVPGSVLPVIAGSNAVNVQGQLSVFAGIAASLVITDYDSFKNYNIVFSAGTFTRNGDTITYTPPTQTGPQTMTINGRVINLTVATAAAQTPTVTSPTNGAINQGANVSVTGSAFVAQGGSYTHLSSNWQISTDPSFSTIYAESQNDTLNLTNWVTPNLSTSLSTMSECRTTVVTEVRPITVIRFPSELWSS